MLGGFNTNVPYKGDVYHVQTEDGGTKNPLLITHLYSRGAILISERYNYAEMLIEEDWKEKVFEAMKAQHKRVIRDLLAGKYSGSSATETAEKEEYESGGGISENSMVDKVLKYILPLEVL